MRVAYLDQYIECKNKEELESNKRMLEPGVIYRVKYTEPVGTDAGAGCKCIYNSSILVYLKSEVSGIPDWQCKLPHKNKEDGYFKRGWLTETEYDSFMENWYK